MRHKVWDRTILLWCPQNKVIKSEIKSEINFVYSWYSGAFPTTRKILIILATFLPHTNIFIVWIMSAFSRKFNLMTFNVFKECFFSEYYPRPRLRHYYFSYRNPSITPSYCTVDFLSKKKACYPIFKKIHLQFPATPILDIGQIALVSVWINKLDGLTLKDALLFPRLRTSFSHIASVKRRSSTDLCRDVCRHVAGQVRVLCYTLTVVCPLSSSFFQTSCGHSWCILVLCNKHPLFSFDEANCSVQHLNLSN